jgi:hypothetical protein
VVTITHLTGLAAQGCDGTTRTGQLIIEYRNEGGGWIATARTRVYPAGPAPLDDFLAGSGDAKSSEVQVIRGQSTRNFVADWTPPTSREASGNGRHGPQYRSDDGGRTWTKITTDDAPQLIESLWVDTASFLPVQWAVIFAPDPARGVSAKPHTILSIRYDERVDLQPPRGIESPDCVP